MNRRKYALIGPPNVGKSSLFYLLTGRFVKTANFPGKTVSMNIGRVVRDGVELMIVDLPGVMNPLNPRDDDEKLALNEAISGDYDGVIVVGAPHAVEESLMLLGVISQYRPVIYVFNMVDIAKPTLSPEEASRLLGVPVVYTSAVNRLGISELVSYLVRNNLGRNANYGVKLEVSPVGRLVATVLAKPTLALLLFIALGVAALFIVMIFMDGTTPWGEFPYALGPLIDSFTDSVADAIDSLNLNPLLISFMKDGLWLGVSAVIYFIPYIAIAMLLVTIYEESGLIGFLGSSLERHFLRVGVPPRGVLCLLVSMSCNVPAQSIARIMWGRANRFLTALLIPYMPCSARLAVFLVILGAVMPQLLPIGVLVPYLVAFIAAYLAGLIHRVVVGATPTEERIPRTPLMIPKGRLVLMKSWHYYVEFLVRITPLIVGATSVLWVFRVTGPVGITTDVSQSWMGIAGRYIGSLFAPLNIPWQVSASLIAGYIFKELIIAFMVAFGGLPLLNSLSYASALALTVFIALYSACMATAVSMVRIVGAKYTALSMIIQFIIALAMAYATYYTVNTVNSIIHYIPRITIQLF